MKRWLLVASVWLLMLTVLTPVNAETNLQINTNRVALNIAFEDAKVLTTCEILDPIVFQDERLGIATVNVPETEVEARQAYYKACDGVQDVYPEQFASKSVVPIDPSYSAYQFNLKRIGLEEAWNTTKGSSSVIVAVIDTGVDPSGTLSDFGTGIILKGVSILTNEITGVQSIKTDTYVGQYSYDGGSHGTAVAMTIAAAMNTKGIAGVAPNIKILPVKVFRDEKTLNEDVLAYNRDIANGIIWAVDNGADIINLSLGSEYSDYALGNAVKYAADRNVILVAASGNNSDHSGEYGCYTCTGHINYPANYQEVIAVGSLNKSNQLSNFSSYIGGSIEIMAYGEDIWLPWRKESKYKYLDGTSFSSPTVAGVLALLLSAYPALTPIQAKGALLSGATDIETYGVGFDDQTGFGLVNVPEALRYASLIEANLDHNETYSTSTPLQLGTALQTSFDYVGDKDMFCLTTYRTESLVLYAESSHGLSFHTAIYRYNATTDTLSLLNAAFIQRLEVSNLSPGTYCGEVYEMNGRVTSEGGSYSVIFDSGLKVTSPRITVTSSTGKLTSGAISFSPVTITIDDSYSHTVTLTKDGIDIPMSGSVISEDGDYVLTVDNVVSDPVIFSFKVRAKLKISGFEDGKLYNKAITVNFTADSATINGNSLISGTTIETDGYYQLVFTLDGVTTETSFRIDRTPPIISGLESYVFYSARPTFNEGTATLNGVPFISGTEITTVGYQTLIVTDEAGNSSHFFFQILDKVTVGTVSVYPGASFVKFTITGYSTAQSYRLSEVDPVTGELHYITDFTYTFTQTGLSDLGKSITYEIQGCRTASGITLCAPATRVTTKTELERVVFSANRINYKTFDLSWTAGEMATSYDIFVNNVLVATTSDLSYRLVMEEPESSQVIWNTKVVATVDIEGVKVQGNSSYLQQLRVATPNPVVTGGALLDDGNYSIRWNKVEGATYYRITTPYLTAPAQYTTETSLIYPGPITNLQFISFTVVAITVLPNGSEVYSNPGVTTLLPVRPTAVTLKGRSTSATNVTLSWDYVRYAKYEVYQLNPQTLEYDLILDDFNTQVISLDDKKLGEIYTFKVRAYIEFNFQKTFGPFSNELTIGTMPQAVTNIRTLSIGADKVYLSWDNQPGITEHQVYVSSAYDGTYTLAATISKSSEGWITGLPFNQVSYIKIKPVVKTDYVTTEGPFSQVISVKTALEVVPNFTASSATYTSNLISWSTVPLATAYELYYSTGTSSPSTLLTTSTKTSFSHTALLTNTTYNYKIRAYRLVGTTKVYGAFSSVMSAKPIPAAPTVSVVSGGTNALKVSWPAIAGASGYEVSYAATEVGTYTLLPLQTALSATIAGLTVDTPYFVKVRAYRLVGTLKVYSGYSAIVSAKPLPLTPTLTGTSGGFDRVNLSWSAIAGAAGYELYRLDGDTYTLISDQTTLSYTDDELVTGTTRSYKVVAYAILSEVKIRSLDSTVLNVTPIPALATNLKASFIDYNLLSLDWTDVSGATGYEISFATTSTGAASVIADVSVSEFTRSGLTFNTTGYYRVRAYTTVSDVKVYGNWTSALAVKTALTTVTNPSAAYTAYNSIQITWSAVNGASGYEVWRSTGTSTTYALVKTQTTVGFLNTALLTNTRYNYKIRAYRLVGTTKVYGAYSGIVSSTPLPWAPNPIATSAAYNALKISWPAVTGANGYEVSFATSEAGPFTVLPTTTLTSATLTNLLTNSTYTVRVRAYRIVNYKKVYGAYSGFITGTPIPSTPAPKVVSGGFDSLNLSWLAIPGATGYDVQWLNPATSTYETLVDTTAVTTIHSGLVSGVAQSYRVYAYRLVGETKVYSLASVVITGTPLPATVLGLKLSATNVSTLDFTWTPVLGASGYEVARSTTSTGVYTTLGSTELNSYQVTGLTFNTTSYLKVRAYTLVGDAKVYGAWTTAVSAKTLPGTPTLTLSSPSYTSVQVDWAAVSGVSGYEIWRSTGTSTTYTLIKTQTTVGFLNTGLAFNTRYNYKIRAYRLVGTTKVYGSYSAITSQTTQVSAPSVLSDSTFDSITLNWAAVTGANGYEVAIATSEGGPFTVSLQTTLTKTFTGLTTGSTYYIKVRSYRLISTTKVYGPYTSVIAVTPSLQIPTLQITGMTSTSITVSWASVPGATDYEIRIRQDAAEAEWVIEEVSDLTVTFNDLDPSAFYAIQIRSLTKDTAVPVYSAYSEELTFSYSETS